MRKKSEENWQVGQECLTAGRLNAAASRLYYGLFQAVLLYAEKKKGYRSPGYGAHRDMIQILYQEARWLVRTYKEMKTLRETADYDAETPTTDEINELLPKCTSIRDLYLKKGNS